jgi:hypothetical protein
VASRLEQLGRVLRRRRERSIQISATAPIQWSDQDEDNGERGRRVAPLALGWRHGKACAAERDEWEKS